MGRDDAGLPLLLGGGGADGAGRAAMISLPWWWLWNPWGEVRRLEFELLTACTLNDRLERKFNLKHAELLEANSRLNLKLSGDALDAAVGEAKFVTDTEMDVPAGLDNRPGDHVERLKAADVRQAEAVKWQQARALNRKLRDILGQVATAGYDLLHKSANQLDQTKGRAFEAMLQFASHETAMGESGRREVKWPEPERLPGDDPARRVQAARSAECHER